MVEHHCFPARTLCAYLAVFEPCQLTTISRFAIKSNFLMDSKSSAFCAWAIVWDCNLRSMHDELRHEKLWHALVCLKTLALLQWTTKPSSLDSRRHVANSRLLRPYFGVVLVLNSRLSLRILPKQACDVTSDAGEVTCCQAHGPALYCDLKLAARWGCQCSGWHQMAAWTPAKYKHAQCNVDDNDNVNAIVEAMLTTILLKCIDYASQTNVRPTTCAI